MIRPMRVLFAATRVAYSLLLVCALSIGGANVGRGDDDTPVANDSESAPRLLDSDDAEVIEPESVVGEEIIGDVIEGEYVDPNKGIRLRLNHHLEGYGEEASNTAIGFNKFWNLGGGGTFFDAQYELDNLSNDSVSVGLGIRWLHNDWLEGDAARVFGAHVWYDGDETQLGNYFSQGSLGIESLGYLWDFRANAYWPMGDRVQAGPTVALGGEDSVGFSGNALTQDTLTPSDASLRAFEAEIARRIREQNIWVFAGGYWLEDDNGEDTSGYKVGVRGYVMDDLAMHFTVTDDDFFNTTAQFGVTWYFGCGGPARAAPRDIYDRLQAPVYRNYYVATRQRVEVGTVELTDDNGDPITIVHVDSDAAAGGDGSFESPLNNLDDILGNSEEGDIVYVHSDSVFNGQVAELQDDQRFLGEGVEHTIETSQFGTVVIPESSPGASDGDVPLIEDAPGDAAVLLADNNEVSGFTIDGGAGVDTRAIAALSGASNTDINRVDISNTPGNGIEITPSTNTTIDEVDFDNVGGDDIVLDGSNTTITDVRSDNPNGIGINLIDATGTTTIEDYDYNGGGSGLGGILFDNPQDTLNLDNVDIAGGTGIGIDIQGGTGTFTFTDADIRNTGDTVFQVDGGSTIINFSGEITQENNASTLAILGGHDGSFTFVEGDIEATNGDGFQFDDADGTYVFSGTTLLDGGDAGIDILNDSSGTFTFADTTTITDPSGTAFNLDGSEADVTYNGDITQSNNASAVAITDHASGTITFQDGTIEATDGDGLQFDNADGTYVFSGTTELDGGDAGIDILNDSGGTFTFADSTTIISPTGTAFNLDNSVADVTYNGDITQNNNAATVAITDHTLGTIIFQDGTIEATDGTGLQFDGAEGTYNFDGQVTLNGGDAGIDILNGSNGTFTFSDITITDPTGTAFNLDGSEADVTYSGDITQNNNAATVEITDHTLGTITFQDGTIEATDGTGLQFDGAEGTYNFSDQVVLNGGDAGIDILSGSDGTFTFSDITITDPTGTAFNLDGSEADVTYNGDITQSNSASAVAITDHASGTITFQDGDIEATDGDGLQFNGADGTYNFIDQVTLNGGDAGIDILGSSDGTFTFSDITITDPT
ncbi:MAG: right-handed parallel beta-helix repeat-containing protein, partial [Pirellulales bacterium]|nr:right-handed parallel beta-helix repeat-containing protein [Pirellulales bacterium]